jgi:hypothetical protein
MSKVEEQKRRTFWLRQFQTWHWMSAAICLIAMLMFSITGITLNHSSQIGAKPEVTTREDRLPAPLLAQLSREPASNKAPLPAAVSDWLKQRLDVHTADHATEWSEDEVYVSLPRPGGDGWLTIARQNGEVRYEVTDRGWVSYLNDLHKGRNTGPLWGWFIDIFAGACVLFAATGLLLLYFHSGRRPSTWPLVALGLALPIVLLVVFVH